MAPEDEIKALAESLSKQGSGWLQGVKSMYEAVPFVERTVQLSIQIGTIFANYPGGLPQEKLEPIRASLEQANSYVSSWAGKTQHDALPQAISGSAFAVSATTNVTGLLAESITNPNATIEQWANKFLPEVESIQSDEKVIQFVASKLKVLYAGGELSFLDSIVEYRRVKNGIGGATSLGIAFRNVLESVLYSRLLQLARKYSGDESIKKWHDMANAVGRGGAGSPESIKLAGQEPDYRTLWTELTQIAKGYKAPKETDWEGIYNRYVGFLYSTLGLVDLKDGI